MKISEHIASLQKALEEHGDQELFMWVDEGDGFLYPVKVPKINLAECDGNEYQIKQEFRNEDGNILIITNLESSDFDRDIDDVQDLDLEIIKTEGN